MQIRFIRTTVCSAFALTLLAGVFTWPQQIWGPPAQAQQLRQEVPGMDHAMELSNAFRHVSRQTLPALVSIQTTGKVVKETVRQRGLPPSFGDDEILRHFFGNDPRFREFMQRGPVERERRMPGGKGSGFIISADGVVMTNSHVVNGAEEVTVRLSDGREFSVSEDKIRTDPRSDVAVIQLDVDEELPFVPLGDDSELEIGDWVLALGSPFGLHRTVTQGIISAKGRGLDRSDIAQEFLQTDAAINPGNSGGPLVNLRGEVIGINTAISTASGGYDGVGFAIPVTAAKWAADQLIEHGTVQRGFLGIQMQQIDAALASHLDLKVPRGIVVTQVIEGSPAEEAGFQVGDVILSVNGTQIASNHNMVGVVERLHVGDTYPIRVLRNEKELELSINIGARPNDDEIAGTQSLNGESAETDQAADSSPLGISVQNLTAELSEQLGVTASGVVITSVSPGSGANEAGLQPGMIISRVGNVAVSNVDELDRAIEAAKSKGQVLLLVRSPAGGGQQAPRFVLVKLAPAE